MILVDDDEPKSLPDERSNLVLVPCWDQRPDDTILTTLCDSLLEHIPSDGDVRLHTAKVCLHGDYHLPISEAVKRLRCAY